MSGAHSILLVGNYPPPYGGVPSHLQSLAPFLADQGWSVHVLTTKYCGTPRRVVDGVNIRSLERRSNLEKCCEFVASADKVLRHFPYVASDPRRFYHGVHLAWQMAEVVRDEAIDLVSAYHLFPAGLSGAWISREFSVPLVTSIFGEVWVDRTLFAERRRETDVVLANSEVILSPSEHCANGLRRYGYPVEVSYYGVDLDRFTGDASPSVVDSLRHECALPEPGAPVVLFVGRMETEMGMGVLLDALPALTARCPTARVILAGRRGTLTERALAEAASDPDRILVFPDASEDVVSCLYALSTVVAVPSLNERACLGLAIAEGSASGKPVVAADAGGGREVLAPGGGTLVAPNDTGALVDALEPFLRDGSFAAETGKVGRAFIEEHFDAKHTNAAIAERFAKLLH